MPAIITTHIAKATLKREPQQGARSCPATAPVAAEASGQTICSQESAVSAASVAPIRRRSRRRTRSSAVVVAAPAADMVAGGSVTPRPPPSEASLG